MKNYLWINRGALLILILLQPERLVKAEELILSSQACEAPSNLEVTFKQSELTSWIFDVKLSWSGPADVTYEYKYLVGLVGESFGTTTDTTFTFISGITTADGGGEFYVRSICNDGAFSDWIRIEFGVPPVFCPEPTDVKIDSSPTGFVMSFKYPMKDGYVFEYVVEDPSTHMQVVYGGAVNRLSPLFVEDRLEPNTLYTLRLQIWCDPNAGGGPAHELAFSIKTLSPCGTDSACFTLVNADTDEALQTLKEGDIITKPANTNINIRYNPAETPASVVFKHQGKVVRTENAAPFALRGDYSGDYLPWTAGSVGNHKVEATPYSEALGKGTAGSTLTINFIIDEASPECQASGTILREYWSSVPGARVSHIPLDSEPSSTNALNIFESPANIGINYATRIRGYICAPATGNYTFWVASNDHSQLWLSIDDDPTNKQLIAFVTGATTPRQWNKFQSQRSASIQLQQGKTYYIEALHKQGVGTDHLAVGWQLPNGTFERPIPGNRLAPSTTETTGVTTFAGESTMQDENAGTSDTGGSNENELEIYPNPTGSGFHELLITGYIGNHGFKSTIEFQLLTGEIVYVTEFTPEGASENYYVSVGEELPPGVYLVNVITNGKRYSKRLLVK